MSRTEEILDGLCEHTLEGEAKPVVELTTEALELGMDPLEILFDALIPALEFVEAIQQHKPQAVGMSAFLTTTMPMFKINIEAITQAGLRDQVKILAGGAPVTQEYCDTVGADGYAPDASSTVCLTKALLGLTEPATS